MKKRKRKTTTIKHARLPAPPPPPPHTHTHPFRKIWSVEELEILSVGNNAQYITPPIAWMRGERKEEALDDLPWKDERGPSSVRRTLTCYLTVLLFVIKQHGSTKIKQHGSDTNGLNTERSLENSVMWAGTMLITPECFSWICVNERVLVVLSMKFPKSLTVWLSSRRLSKKCSLCRFISHQTDLFKNILLGVVIVGHFRRVLLIPKQAKRPPRVRTPFADQATNRLSPKYVNNVPCHRLLFCTAFWSVRCSRVINSKTRKFLHGSFLCAVYKFSFIHSFTPLCVINDNEIQPVLAYCTRRFIA